MPKLFAGLDVSGKTTAICVVDGSGVIVFETETATTAEAVDSALRPYRRSLQTVGHEASGFARQLQRGLAKAKYPIVSLDTYSAHSALKARLNKTDKNDAQGLARLVASGQFVLSHEKSDEAIRLRAILLTREILLRKSVDVRIAIKAIQRSVVEVALPDNRNRSLDTDSSIALEEALTHIHETAAVLKVHCVQMDRLVAGVVEGNTVCRRLMTIPGVGRITSLYYVTGVDNPYRFSASRTVAAYFGLTPRTFQSGEVSHSGGISHRGDPEVRRALFIAARALLITSRSNCRLRQWGLRISKAKGLKVGCIAVARKLAVLMHRMWVTGQDFDPSR